MEGDDVAEFILADGTRKHYCLFHLPKAPLNSFRQLYKYNNNFRYSQGRRLKELLDQWNKENKRRIAENKGTLIFILPGIRCRGVDLGHFPFSSGIYFNDATFKGNWLFDNATFKGDVSFVSVKFDSVVFLKTIFEKQSYFDKAELGLNKPSPVDLSSAQFKGDAFFIETRFFSEANFESAIFEKTADFSNQAIFYDNANFYMTQFNGGAIFYGARFNETDGEEAIFTNSLFKGSALFGNEKKELVTIFNGNVKFQHVTFEGVSFFTNAHFKKSAFFNGASLFSGAANFDNATFGENADKYDKVNFDSAIFHNDLSFEGAKFNEKLIFTLTELKKGGRFTKCNFTKFEYKTHTGQRLLFNDCDVASASGTLTFADQDCSRLSFLDMDLTKADFLGASVRKAEFEACRWEKPKSELPYAFVYNHEKIVSKKEGIENDDEKKKEREKELLKLNALYRQLTKNLEENRDYGNAGDFHFREMETRLIMRKEDAKAQTTLEIILLHLYRFFADYGENYVKLFGYLIASFLVSAIFLSWEEKFEPVAVAGSFALFFPLVYASWDNETGHLAPWLMSISLISSLILTGIYTGYLGGALEYVVYGGLPGGLQESVANTIACLSWFSKAVIYMETLVSLVLATLFVMAVNRRFRR